MKVSPIKIHSTHVERVPIDLGVELGSLESGRSTLLTAAKLRKANILSFHDSF